MKNALDIVLLRSRKHLINISVLRGIYIRIECISTRLDHVSKVQYHLMVVRVRCHCDGSAGNCRSHPLQGCETGVRETT